MAINLSGQAIQDVRVAGVQAQQVMLGTGSTAVEVWSADIRSGAQIWMPLDPPGTPLLQHAGTLTPAISTSTLQARDGYAYTASGAGAGASMHYAGTWDTGGTVSMWVRQTGQSGGAHAAFYRKSGTTEVAMWQQVGASPPYILFSLIMNGVVVDLHATSVPVPNSQWVMVTITVSRSAGSSSWTVRGYVNGQPAGSVTRSAVAQPIAPGDISFAGTSWGGDLDDLLVWDRALSPAEVAQVWQASLPPRYTVSLGGTTMQLSQNVETTVLSHTVTRAGAANITGSLYWGTQGSSSTYTARVRVNGFECAGYNVRQRSQSASTGELILSSGDVVTVTATTNSGTASYRTVTSSTLAFT